MFMLQYRNLDLVTTKGFPRTIMNDTGHFLIISNEVERPCENCYNIGPINHRTTLKKVHHSLNTHTITIKGHELDK